MVLLEYPVFQGKKQWNKDVKKTAQSGLTYPPKSGIDGGAGPFRVVYTSDGKFCDFMTHKTIENIPGTGIRAGGDFALCSGP